VSDVATTLELLTCGQCATPVVLADAESVRCPSCGADVAVPAAHRAAFAATRRDQVARAEATALYAQLGAPPRALRAIGLMFDPSGAVRPLRGSQHLLLRLVGWYYGWALIVVAPLAMLLLAIVAVNLTMRAVGAHYHANVMDTLPSATRDWLQLPAAFAAMLIGTALGVYGRRRAISRQRLQASLAARPPTRAGGPSACRLCGAPLSVPADARGVRCVYCGADNLVALPPAWLARVGADVGRLDGAIEEASRALTRERARLRRALFIQVGVTAAALAVILTLALLVERAEVHEDDGVPPPWGAYAVDPRPLVRRGLGEVNGRGERTLADHVGVVRFAGGCPAGAQPFTFAAADCDGAGCRARFYAALRAGDHVAITLGGVPATAEVRVERHTGWPWPTDPAGRFGELLGTLPVASGAARFDATWSAWHQLLVQTPLPSPEHATICVDVHAAR
jgi:DNA-directed RNA polymerase subunit RPC12/RpoP